MLSRSVGEHQAILATTEAILLCTSGPVLLAAHWLNFHGTARNHCDHFEDRVLRVEQTFAIDFPTASTP